MDLEALKKSAEEQRRRDVSDGVIQFLVGWTYAAFTAFLPAQVALWAVGLAHESLWFLPVLFVVLAVMALLFYGAATYICEPLNLYSTGHQLGLAAIFLFATAVYFDREIEPWGKGPHLKRVVIAPVSAFRVAEVEWHRGPDGAELRQVKTRDGETVDLYTCEGDVLRFDAICVGDNERKWVVRPYER